MSSRPPFIEIETSFRGEKKIRYVHVEEIRAVEPLGDNTCIILVCGRRTIVTMDYAAMKKAIAVGYYTLP